MVLGNKNEKEHDSMSKQHQPYDSALKSLFGNEAAEILPNILPGSEFISEQNIEIDLYGLERSCDVQGAYLNKKSRKWRLICVHTTVY